ncbi:MAG: Rab family GTPase [Candidatus Hodarchaeota archaeon]
MFNEYLFKIVCLGSPFSNKTKILRGYVEGKFDTNYLPTLGVDIATKRIRIDNNQIKLIIVDTAGQEFFGKLRPSYFRGASGALIFFDHKNRTTFESQVTPQQIPKKMKKSSSFWQKVIKKLGVIFHRLFPKEELLNVKTNNVVPERIEPNNHPPSVIIQFYHEFKKYIPDSTIPIGLIGIQDGPDSFQVSLEEAQDLAYQLGIDYFALRSSKSRDLERILIDLIHQGLRIRE